MYKRLELKQKILSLSNENASLTSSINYNIEEISKAKEKNNQLMKKNTLMRASLANINEKNRQIACQIRNEFGFQAMPEFNEFFYGAVPSSSIMTKPKSQTVNSNGENDNIKRVVLFPSSQ